MHYPKSIYRRTSTPFICGLDLGKAQDYTALVLMERIDRAGAWNSAFWAYDVESTLVLRSIHRFPLGTPYTDIVQDVKRLVHEPNLFERTQLVVDATGVGSAVIEMIDRARTKAELTAVTITGGERATKDSWRASVPKKDLVSALAVMLQREWLQVPRSTPFADLLLQELTNFRVRYTGTGNQTFEAWRDRDHDDLVLAMALACWKATSMWREFNDEMAPGPRDVPRGTVLDDRFSSSAQVQLFWW